MLLETRARLLVSNVQREIFKHLGWQKDGMKTQAIEALKHCLLDWKGLKLHLCVDVAMSFMQERDEWHIRRGMSDVERDEGRERIPQTLQWVNWKM